MYKYNPPHLDTIRIMNMISAIIFIIIGIFLIFYGLMYIFIFTGLFPLIIGIIDIISAVKVLKINEFVKNKQYVLAKNITLQYMVLGFIFGIILPGIILLISHSKYDDIISYHQTYLKNIKNINR
ncbi:MAG: hypothetical protein ACP5RZ_00915 [Thermoplasmata archaeon]